MQTGKRSVGNGAAWRPDTRASFTLAAVATLLVMGGFAALFASTTSIKFLQPTASVAERLFFAVPQPPRPPLRRRAPTPSPPAPIPMLDQAWPPLQPPISLPEAFTVQDYLRERAQQDATALRDKVTGNELRRSLGKSADQPALRDNQSIPTAGGDRVVRSGDSCAQIHTVQGSSSPTNKIDLAEPMSSCPGTSDRDMGKALQDWAEKHRPPPPLWALK